MIEQPPSLRRNERPRVAVVAPYATYWESAVPYDFRAERERLLDEAVRRLEGSCTVVWRGVVASREDGARAGEQARAASVDALVVVQTMAAMPAFALAALEADPSLPAVVWALTRLEALPESFDHTLITTEGATVGAPMLTSTLVRAGRRFALVLGRLDDDAAVAEVALALRAARAARRLRRARIGCVGPPIDGYLHVVADPERLEREIGASLVRIEAAELRDLYLSVEASRVRELEAVVRATHRIDADVEGDPLGRSLRAACALDDLVARHRLDAGALNCHVPELRFGAEVGIAPCFALGLSTSHGIPWTCTGDVLTAVAQLTLTLLGGAAQYHELESFDWTTEEFVLASSGEHDRAFGSEEQPALIRNGWFAGDPHCGVCACFGAPAGPATLAAFTQIDRPEPAFRFVVAQGEFTGRAFPDVGTPWAAFRFANGPGASCWRRWCEAGAGHHSAATPGDYASAIELVARFLGVEAVLV